MLIPTYKNKKGHPPIFNAQFKKEFLNMDNSIGLNVFMKEMNLSPALFPVNDEGIVLTFNTLEEFASLKKIYRKTSDFFS